VEVTVMAMQVALLRGINVAGNSRVGMSELREVFVDLGLSDVTTYLQSGNVVFNATAANAGQLVASLEKQIAARFGVKVSVLIRTHKELSRVIAANPYLDLEDDPTKLHVTFLARKPELSKVKSLEVPTGETGRFTVIGREVYLHCPDGYGRTKLNNSFFERKLYVSATTRNWKSVTALNALVGD
jgi:uncharacterized protein (DUF1697 family)